MKPPERSAGAAEPADAPIRATLALLAMVAIWAVNFSVAKRALSFLSPLAFNALRFPLAAVVLLVALRRRGPIRMPARRDLWAFVGLGILGNVVYQLCFIYGLAHTRAGTASVLLAGTPIVTALLSALVGHEKVNGATWLGVLATFVGITLVIGSTAGDTAERADRILGDVLMLAATVAWAVYTVANRNLIRRYGAVSVTAWTLWFGSAVVVVIGLRDVFATDLAALSFETWFAVAYAGGLSIGIAYTFWAYGVRQLGNTRTATYSNLVPALALLVAWIWLGEVPTARQALGAGIIIAGVTAVQIAGARRRQTPVAPSQHG
jgi:drug/metabolite transporter (DMT)-like permease